MERLRRLEYHRLLAGGSKRDGLSYLEHERLLRPRFRLMPGVQGRPGREIVETKVLLRQQFCEQDDLTRVHREVFDSMKDGFQRRHVTALHLMPNYQLIRIELR